MMSQEEMSNALQYLLDRQAIWDCVQRFARGVDRLDVDLMRSAFHEDALDDHGVFAGTAEELADWVVKVTGKGLLTAQHLVGTHTCELDGDVAHAETYYLFFGMTANGAGDPVSSGGGRYVDRFEKRDGRWAIAARKEIRDWFPAKTHLTSARQFDLTSAKAFLKPEEVDLLKSFAEATRDHNDPSYDRPLTIDPARVEAARRVAEGA